MITKFLIVVTMLLISDSLLASVSCEQYFEYQKIEISQNISREERREAEIYNLERAFALGITEYTVADLNQLVRAQKWLQNRGTHLQNLRVKAHLEAAEAHIFASTLDILHQKNELSYLDWDYLMGASKWFKDHYPQDKFLQLRDSFMNGQIRFIRSIEQIMKKSDSKLTKQDVKSLFRMLKISERLDLNDINTEVQQRLISITKYTLDIALEHFDFGTQPKNTFKHLINDNIASEYLRQIFEIGKNPNEAGTLITGSTGGSANGYRSRKYGFSGTQYRILYKKLDNDRIYIHFIGTHEEYNAFF